MIRCLHMRNVAFNDDDKVFCLKAGRGDGTFVPPIRLPYQMSTGGMAEGKWA